MRKYHKKAERKDDLRNVDFVRLKKNLTPNEADIDELVKFCELELFMGEIYLDYQKPFIREFGVKGYQLSAAVIKIIEERLKKNDDL